MTTAVLRDAKARVAAIATEQADLQRQIDELEKPRVPLVAHLNQARRRRTRVQIISNTAGSIWFGTLASIGVESFGLNHLAKSHAGSRKLATEISDAITSGGLKLNGGRYGVAITLRGLAGRVRVPDSAHVLAHKRAVSARERAEAKATAARQAEADALRACFDTAVKVPTEAILPDLVSEAVAIARLDRVPLAHELRHRLGQLEVDDDWSPLGIAKAHLAFVQSGSTEPCPCRTCAHDRQEAIKLRDLNARLDELPTVMVDKCPDEAHGRHRVAIERGQLRLNDDWRKRLDEISPGIAALLPAKPGLYAADPVVDAPRGWCRKGKEPVPFIRVETWRVELDKATKKRRKGLVGDQILADAAPPI